MTVWTFVVLGFLGAADGQQVGVIAQNNQTVLGRFVLPTHEACEAAREGVREFAATANQTLLIGGCREEPRSPQETAGLKRN
jgi:hypothetical protein